jgi:ABC-type antimicrobial peptide transport system permease subunit
VTLREGRFFSDRDTSLSEPVAIVNETFARMLLPRSTSRVTGQRVSIVRPGDTADVRTIVGTIGNIRDSHVDREPEPEIYLPLAQFNGVAWSNTLAVAVRTNGVKPESIMTAVRQTILEADPAQPISQVFTTQDLLERRLVRPQFNLQMMMTVALLGVACVSLGLFGVLAYIARLRSTEFAVRLAIGARPAQVAKVVLVEALELSTFGLLAGVLAMTLLVPLLQSELYGVARLDTVMVAAVALVVAAVTLASVIVPARYAARVDATACLR